MMKVQKYKNFLIPALVIFILSIFTVTVFANSRNNLKKVKSSTPTPTIKPVATKTPSASTTNVTVYITWYGWPDNDPAGIAIAYPKNDGYPTIHNGAGGAGTFDDPVTFAAKIGRFSIGQKLYVPYIKKYVILEDTCASCKTEQIDIWMESDGQNENKVIACEEHWTKENVGIEVNPPAGREVSTTPIFNKLTGTCQN